MSDQSDKENLNVANRKPETALAIVAQAGIDLRERVLGLGLEDPELPGIATQILIEYARGVAGTQEAFEARLAIGALLVTARAKIASDPLFGQWVAEQDFPWGATWTRMLMQASRLEPYVREALLDTRVSGDDGVNIQKALAAAKQAAIVTGDWTAPAPKPEREGDDDLQEPAAQLVLLGLLESLDVINFMAIPDSEWLAITPSQRATASEFFKKVAGRMVAVHILWQS